MPEEGGEDEHQQQHPEQHQLRVRLLQPHCDGEVARPEAQEQQARGRWHAPTTTRALAAFLVWARVELLGFAALLLAGVLMGVVLPKDPKLTDPGVTTASNVLGWAYFLAWTVSFYPQVVLNHRRRTTVGLSFSFLLLNAYGFLAYTAFASAFYGSSRIREAYAERHGGHESKVAVQDLFFAAHAVGITVVTIAQMLYWDGVVSTLRTRLSRPVSCLLGLLLLGAGLGAVLAATVGGNSPGAWLSFLYLLSYQKLFISTTKGIPQAMLNHRRKSTEGWSIHNILCDFCGGLFSVGQLLLDCWATDDWSGIRGDPLKFGLGLVSMLFDIFFCVQHFVLYPSPPPQPPRGRGGGEEDGEDVLV